MHHLSRPSRAGFTLVELLVVIGIIGVLVALLLPAVQSARESARRSECSGQLRDIALAVAMHHDARGHYPTGRTGSTQYGVTWAFELLPYLEASAVHDAYSPWLRVDDAGNATAMRTAIGTFVCPSRRRPAADRDFDNEGEPPLVLAAGAAGDYAANAGKGILLGFDAATHTQSRDLDPAEVGPIFTFSRVAARRVVDGLSKTLAAGEKHLGPPPQDAPPDRLQYFQGDTAYFSGDNPRGALRCSSPGLRADSDSAGETAAAAVGPDEPTPPSGRPHDAFGGPHPGVTIMALLDGAVKPLANTTSVDALTRLATIGDGQPRGEE